MLLQESPPGTDPLLTHTEAEKFLRMSRWTLTKKTKAGLLAVVYVDSRPRYLFSDLQAFVEAHRRPASG